MEQLRGSKCYLNEKELHCIARMLQSALFADSLFYGCNFCRYRNKCFDGNKPVAMHLDEIRKKLQDITGVDLKPIYDRNNLEAKFRNYQS